MGRKTPGEQLERSAKCVTAGLKIPGNHRELIQVSGQGLDRHAIAKSSAGCAGRVPVTPERGHSLYAKSLILKGKNLAYLFATTYAKGECPH
jgi:hypothetical protein